MAKRKKDEPRIKALEYFAMVLKANVGAKHGVDKLPKERRVEIARMGGIARREKYGKNSVQAGNESSPKGKTK